jgi:hypothetical protein
MAKKMKDKFMDGLADAKEVAWCGCGDEITGEGNADEGPVCATCAMRLFDEHDKYYMIIDIFNRYRDLVDATWNCWNLVKHSKLQAYPVTLLNNKLVWISSVTGEINRYFINLVEKIIKNF